MRNGFSIFWASSQSFQVAFLPRGQASNMSSSIHWESSKPGKRGVVYPHARIVNTSPVWAKFTIPSQFFRLLLSRNRAFRIVATVCRDEMPRSCFVSFPKCIRQARSQASTSRMCRTTQAVNHTGRSIIVYLDSKIEGYGCICFPVLFGCKRNSADSPQG